ncbi:3-deoxy-D-manno-octulosonic acid transferase [Candidatus Obscuribacterales bacterium]|nr:3-deoxy-D-manno-octulosonic acid transferase [Candidatus Obscuribacterales bacterium]
MRAFRAQLSLLNKAHAKDIHRILSLPIGTGTFIEVIVVYYLVFALVLVIAGPFLLLQKKARAGLSQKFGNIPSTIALDADKLKFGIWIHAVSVGEFNAVKPLIERIHEEIPELPIVVSTTTLTGQTLAQERVGRFARVFYFPFDLPFATGRWLDALKPQMVVIAETELWPGFLTQCRQRGIKTLLANGRMSPKSFKSYNRFRFFFGTALRKYTQIAAQSESEAKRYRAVAGQNIPVVVTGNMKLDGLRTEGDTIVGHLRERVNVSEKDFVIVAGSTHDGEETALLAAYRQLLENYASGRNEQSSSLETRETESRTALPRPRLIIAPRHPERFEKVVELVAANGFQPKRFSKDEKFVDDKDVYVLDGLGQLARYYSLATVGFVGGTIKNVGGHNLLEPYAYSVPTICGPHVHKTRDIANALMDLECLVMVHTPQELTAKLCEFHRDQEPARILGKKGLDWINQNQGAVDRTMKLIVETLGTQQSRSEFVAKHG